MTESPPPISVAGPDPQALTVHRTDVGYRTVLAVIGEIDLDTAPLLRSAVNAAFESRARELWVDLSETTFVDSSGVRLLLDADQRARGLRRSLMVICPPGSARRTFEIAGVDHSLQLYDDLAAAHAMRESERPRL